MMILSYSLSRYFDLSFMYMTSRSEWWQYLTYTLIHNSIAHLSVNIAMLIIYWNALGKTHSPKAIIPICFISSIISSFLCSKVTPTVGASALVFSLMGIFTANMWTTKNSNRLRFTLTLMTMVIIQTLVGFKNVNWQLHLVSYGFSIILTLPYGYISKKYR